MYVTLLFGVWILALRHNRISLYELEFNPHKPLGVVLKGCDLVVKRGPDARVRLKIARGDGAWSMQGVLGALCCNFDLAENPYKVSST